ncbi:hypothetical protein [Synechococcus phage S-H9-2]|jgi:hypothetical protein|uniref:Uncharacterized protein n=1 Tax=Synechococcus phage S-H9-2 TaxID=2783669 RepID=A0A873WEF7_9CAUD|nr:hypothetical protein PQC10_gp172 [Synechococcus phage S-H9-2]QPB08418.1 hypothetical protein [Synechococcus phage S-H9-2]
MLELLLYASIACQDATEMIGRIEANENMSKIIRTEIVETIKEATPHCKWDAHD